MKKKYRSEEIRGEGSLQGLGVGEREEHEEGRSLDDFAIRVYFEVLLNKEIKIKENTQ